MKIEIISQRSGIYGGLKRLYRLATYCIRAGHQAVVNIDDNSTNSWFEHIVPENITIEPDIRIMPETWQKPHPTAKNILYVQAQFDPPKKQFDCIVTTTGYLANKICREGFHPDYIVPYGLDNTVFKPDLNKYIAGQIAYMPRKNKQEIALIKMLAPDMKYVVIDDNNEETVIDLLQQSDIFLSTSREEGFGLPPFEASLCGCLVVGYHGKGGRKWLTKDNCVLCDFPQEIAQVLPKAIAGAYETNRQNLQKLIKTDLTLEKEAKAWLNILSDIFA